MSPGEQALLRRAVQAVLGVGLTGLGVGAGARALWEVPNLMHPKPKNLIEYGAPLPAALPVPVPKHLLKTDDEEHPLRKAAEVLSKEAQRAGLNWWQIPASAALGMGGVAGGWKVIDAMLDSRRRAELNQELQDAQRDYEDALRAQYEQALLKQGCLDGIFARIQEFEKRSNQWGRVLRDIWEGLLGTYATAAGGSAVMGGIGGYHWARSRSRRRALEQAMKTRRRQMLQSGSVPGLYAYPVSLPTHPSKAQRDEELQAL